MTFKLSPRMMDISLGLGRALLPFCDLANIVSHRIAGKVTAGARLFSLKPSRPNQSADCLDKHRGGYISDPAPNGLPARQRDPRFTAEWRPDRAPVGGMPDLIAQIL